MTNMAKVEEHIDLGIRSAGRIMSVKIPIIHASATIAEVEKLLLEKTSDLETINYIYVVDSQKKLIGVFSVKEMFRSPKNAQVSNIMTQSLITARPHTDQKRVALLAIEHSLKEIPVIDGEDHLLGAVPSDAIVQALHDSNIEDALRSAGVHGFNEPVQSIIKASAGQMIKKRLPWLFVGLGGTAVAAGIVGAFKGTLESQLLLAAFIPAVAYISGAVGTQSEAIIVRTLALDRKFKFTSYLLREFKTAIGIAILLSLGMSAIALIFWHDKLLSIILGISFLISIILSMIVAVLLPWFFSKIRIDPALPSGPFGTIISDIISIIAYLTVATLVLRILS